MAISSHRSMNKRPISVVVIGWLYIVTGAIGFASHLTDFMLRRSSQVDAILISLVGLLAIVAGAYMLRGRNWARWLAIAWIGFHVIVGALNSWFAFAMHSVLLAAFAYLLFRSDATHYFRTTGTQAT